MLTIRVHHFEMESSLLVLDRLLKRPEPAATRPQGTGCRSVGAWTRRWAAADL